MLGVVSGEGPHFRHCQLCGLVAVPVAADRLTMATAALLPAPPYCVSAAVTQACRNFVQLAMEGYYDGTIFHRVIKDYIAQAGDPTGSGTGACSGQCRAGQQLGLVRELAFAYGQPRWRRACWWRWWLDGGGGGLVVAVGLEAWALARERRCRAHVTYAQHTDTCMV